MTHLRFPWLIFEPDQWFDHPAPMQIFDLSEEPEGDLTN